ncbi:MAG TPA: glycosyltransferase family 1 protein [Methylococcaceae bacterium]|nr:glycosyltransferase family 1 protein [Methylococcaceae bacterium]
MQKKHKIIYLINEDYYFLSHRLAIAKAALKSGYEVIVLTNVNKHGDKIIEEGFRLIPISIKRGGINPLRELKTIIDIFKVYRIEKPDLVHQVALKQVLYGGIAAFFCKDIKIVNLVAGLGSLFISSHFKDRVIKIIVKSVLTLLLKRPGVFTIVQNPDDKAMLVDSLQIAEESLFLIRGSGVNVERFYFSEEVASPVVVALVSRMLWDKGIAEFIDAVKQLKAKQIEFSAVLVGDSDNENSKTVTRTELQKWHDDGLITWLGYQEDIAQVWRSAHIAVLPSYREGLPKALLEAGACGRAIVTTDTPGCREVVQDGVNGFLVPVRDANALALALEKLINNSELRKAMGRKSREIVTAEFSDEKVVAQTFDVYRKLLCTNAH